MPPEAVEDRDFNSFMCDRFETDVVVDVDRPPLLDDLALSSATTFRRSTAGAKTLWNGGRWWFADARFFAEIRRFSKLTSKADEARRPSSCLFIIVLAHVDIDDVEGRRAIVSVALALARITLRTGGRPSRLPGQNGGLPPTCPAAPEYTSGVDARTPRRRRLARRPRVVLDVKVRLTGLRRPCCQLFQQTADAARAQRAALEHDCTGEPP